MLQPLVNADSGAVGGVNVVHVLERTDAERDESHAANAQLNGKEADDGTHDPSEETTPVIQLSGDLGTKTCDKVMYIPSNSNWLASYKTPVH